MAAATLPAGSIAGLISAPFDCIGAGTSGVDGGRRAPPQTPLIRLHTASHHPWEDMGMDIDETGAEQQRTAGAVALRSACAGRDFAGQLHRCDLAAHNRDIEPSPGSELRCTVRLGTADDQVELGGSHRDHVSATGISATPAARRRAYIYP
eukprot:SAG31_NODE_2763_length_5128_cov_25.339232_4_plen_151_part_00